MNAKKKLSLSLGTLVLTGGLLMGMTADEALRQTGIAGGLCAIPRASTNDIALILNLAGRPTFIVHAMSTDAQTVARIRDEAQAAGILNKSLYVELATGAAFPYADREVDILLINSVKNADLTSDLQRECLRVIAPRRGAALVGRAKEAGDGLSRGALKHWIKDLGKADTVSDKSGRWVLLKTDLPAGSDSWAHRCHAPANDQVSGDTTLQAPFLTQWWGMPRQEGFWGTTVVAANGRMFSLRGSRSSREDVFLTARALNNGIVLWSRPVRQAPEKATVPHGGYIPGRSCIAVVGDSLFLVYSNGVARLDAETGAEKAVIPGPRPDGQIKWIACAKDLIAMLAGEPDTVTPIAYQTVAANPVGRNLAVYDTRRNKLLWQDTLPGDTDERMIALRDDRLYYLAQGQGLVCRELRSGKPLWTNADPLLQSEFLTPDMKVIGQFLVSQPVLIAYDDVLLLRAKWATNTVALSRKDGSILWKSPTAAGSYRALTACAINGLLMGAGPTPLDLNTGKKAAGPKFIGSGCGPTTATPNYLITCFGAVLDMRTNLVIRQEDIKSPCDIGTILCEGMMITMPSECGCFYQVKGYRALTSAGPIRPHTAPDWKGRLASFNTAEPAPLAVLPEDWPTYRHDPRRSGFSPVTVGAASNVLWRWTPAGAPAATNKPAAKGLRLAPEFIGTAPVAAGGRAWFASADGRVHCVDGATGTELWSFPTAGLVFAPPTIHDGRVLVGGGDGRIYGLDATTGRCLWQFQAAPLDRRILWFGHLISTWPVLSGVVVQDGVAYAVAGYQKENGIHAYAFDPKTGQVTWERGDAGRGANGNPQSGLNSEGNVAIADGRLWLASHPTGYFDLKTGDWKVQGIGRYASEIGIMGPWVLQGGRRLSETQDTLWRPLGGSGWSVTSADPTFQRTFLTDAGTTLPAWDKEVVLMPPKGLQGPLTALAQSNLTAWISERPAALSAATKTPKDAPKPALAEFADLKMWASESVLPAAIAMAKDQMVVSRADNGRFSVSGFSRADGSNIWTTTLPSQPVMNGLALDREGRVLVTLCDGSVLCLSR
jgi:outer membrane protein assembly factor BamB